MSDLIVPSFVGKLGRAEKHLVDLKASIERYGGTDVSNRPYTVRKRVEGNGRRTRTVFRIHFRSSIENTDIPLIVADAIYDMRSSLEHLMAAMVASKDRDSCTFPIFWRGVWKPWVPGDNAQRRKDRQRWLSIANALPDEAVTYLKRLQPPDDALEAQEVHHLRLLNQFSNTDRHTKLPVIAAGLSESLFRNYKADGSYVDGVGRPGEGSFFEPDAEVHALPGTVKMEVTGTPQVVIRTRLKDDNGDVINLPVVDFVNDGIVFIRDKIIPTLAPYGASATTAALIGLTHCRRRSCD
jgi:hypothetical protein